MTEGQQQGQQGTQQQGTEGQQPQQQQTPPPPDVNSVAAAARRDGEDTGYQKAARELGVSIEDAKQILADAKKRSDAEKTAEQRLQEREGELTAAKDESKSHKQRADRFEKVIKANVESQIESLPEDIKDLLANFDVAGQFEWLTKHGAKYNPDASVNQPDEGQIGTRRAPDASRSQKIPGLDESSQQFNDLLRARGLSSGVS